MLQKHILLVFQVFASIRVIPWAEVLEKFKDYCVKGNPKVIV